MGIIRVPKVRDYTVMSNYHLRDKSLTLKSKGLMSLMLSLPDDWDYSIAGLVAIVSEGESAVRNAINELIQHKYLVREKVYTNGRISDWNYTLYEMPTDVELPVENQQLENQVQDSLVQGFSAQINTDINKIKKENKIKNNKSTGAGALAKHPRNFSKEKLSDDLSSGEIIDAQKKEKKKQSEYDKCLDEIKKRYFNSPVQLLLQDHLEWSYNSRDPKRIRTLKIYSKRLDELDKLEGDKEKIVAQSIEKQWHCFYELQKSDSHIRGNTADNSILTSQKISKDEVQNILAQRAERNGII